jgi:hypothetical protein
MRDIGSGSFQSKPENPKPEFMVRRCGSIISLETARTTATYACVSLLRGPAFRRPGVGDQLVQADFNA